MFLPKAYTWVSYYSSAGSYGFLKKSDMTALHSSSVREYCSGFVVRMWSQKCCCIRRGYALCETNDTELFKFTVNDDVDMFGFEYAVVLVRELNNVCPYRH